MTAIPFMAAEISSEPSFLHTFTAPKDGTYLINGHKLISLQAGETIKLSGEPHD